MVNHTKWEFEGKIMLREFEIPFTSYHKRHENYFKHVISHGSIVVVQVFVVVTCVVI